MQSQETQGPPPHQLGPDLLLLINENDEACMSLENVRACVLACVTASYFKAA